MVIKEEGYQVNIPTEYNDRPTWFIHAAEYISKEYISNLNPLRIVLLEFAEAWNREFTSEFMPHHVNRHFKIIFKSEAEYVAFVLEWS